MFGMTFRHLIYCISLYSFLLLPVLLLLYCIGLSVYRLFLHPYAKYPGPLLAKLTPLYGFYHAYKGDFHIDVWRCHEEYGTYVRYSPDRVIINTNTAIKGIYGNNKNIQKSKAYDPLPLSKGVFNVFNAIDKVIHGRKRRIVSQAFSDSALKSSEPFIINHIRNFCNCLLETVGTDDKVSAGAWTSPKNVAVWSTHMTTDVVSDLSFGKSFQLLNKPDMHFITESIGSYVSRGFMAMQYPALFSQGTGSWLSLHTWLFPGLLDRGRYAQATGNVAQERIDSKDSMKDRKDIMSLLLEAEDPETGEKLSTMEVRSEAHLMISAGSDTTATAISAALFYLSRNPGAYKRLATEIRSTFSSVELIRRGCALSSCAYLRACLDEAMRMSPPAPGVFFREVLNGGAMINGEFIPGGYDVGTGIYAIHHNPAYFPDPFTYKPERWIVSATNPESQIELAKSAFIPFSYGPRACVAKPLAYLEMTLAVAMIFYLVDFRVAQGEIGRVGEGRPELEYGRHRVGEYQIRDQMTSAKDGPMLTFRIREKC